MAEIEEAEIEAEPEAGPSAHWEHDHTAANSEGRRLCPVCTFLNEEEGDTMQCGMCHNSFCEDLWASASAADLQRSSDNGSTERNWSLSSYIPGMAPKPALKDLCSLLGKKRDRSFHRPPVDSFALKCLVLHLVTLPEERNTLSQFDPEGSAA